MESDLTRDDIIDIVRQLHKKSQDQRRNSIDRRLMREEMERLVEKYHIMTNEVYK